MSVSTCRLTVDFILFLLLFCSAFFYLGLHGGTKFKIEASRNKQKKIEDEIEGLPQGRAGACRSPRPPRHVRSQYPGRYGFCARPRSASSVSGKLFLLRMSTIQPRPNGTGPGSA